MGEGAWSSNLRFSGRRRACLWGVLPLTGVTRTLSHMDAANVSDPARPVYAHHVRALEARMKQAELEAVGKNWLRGGFRDQRAKDSGTARKAPPYG